MLALHRLRKRFRRHPSLGRRVSPCESCPLGACPAGTEATIVCVACPALDAHHLRTLGVFEGTRVGIVDARRGMVLDVRGSRLAIGQGVVDGITVRRDHD